MATSPVEDLVVPAGWDMGSAMDLGYLPAALEARRGPKSTPRLIGIIESEALFDLT